MSELSERFPELFYHKVTDQQTIAVMKEIRAWYIDLWATIDDLMPDCRSKSLARTALEDSLMRAIQALAVTRGELQLPTSAEEKPSRG